MTQTETATQTKQVLFRKRESGVAFVIFDSATKVNSLSSSTQVEFRECIERASKDPTVKAVAILSGKADSFIHGADLHEIMKFGTFDEALKMSSIGQATLQMAANLDKPTVAAIIGPALGGGLELALCADKRIAVDVPITQIGMPEVKLGLIPGLGGTQLLPQVVGVKNALELIVSAEPIDAKRALEMGVVDELVPAEKMLERAEALCLEMIGKSKSERRRPAPQMEPEKQNKLFAMTDRSLRIKTKGRYPAYQKAVEAIKKGLDAGLEAGLKFEAQAFAELSVTDTSSNLVFLYLSTEFARQTAIASAKKFPTARPVTVAVLGGGLMGGEIAHQAATHGVNVICKSADPARQDLFLNKLRNAFESSDSEKSKQALDLIHSGTDADTLKKSTIVVEAATEDEQKKISLLKELAEKVQPDTVITTNTSSFSITQLAQHVPNKKNFLGMHFFHPVDKMPLVEVIAHAETDRAAVAQAFGLAHSLEKIPMKVKDSPAFLVNRLLGTYLAEAGRLMEERIPIAWLEDSALAFGMPMGPVTLLDEVGIDVAISVAQVLHKAYGDRQTPPQCLVRAAEVGLIGKKTLNGAFLYNESGKKLEINPIIETDLNLVAKGESELTPELSQELAEAMLLPMVDEACRCLEEGVVRRAREIDLCMVAGLGFPAFRGGLLRWCDTMGVDTLIKKLEAIYAKRGPKRSVSDYLLKLQRENRGFYSRGSEDG